MGYPAKLLHPGEHVAVDVRKHWKSLGGPVVAVGTGLAGSLAALADPVPGWCMFPIAGVLGAAVVWLCARYAKWAATSFVVTDERLVLRAGVFGRSGREVRLDRLIGVSYRQSLIDRLTGCGDILLEWPGREEDEVFEDLPDPRGIQQEIYNLVTRRSAGPEVRPARSPARL